jgi:hypothetical protein
MLWYTSNNFYRKSRCHSFGCGFIKMIHQIKGKIFLTSWSKISHFTAYILHLYGKEVYNETQNKNWLDFCFDFSIEVYEDILGFYLLWFSHLAKLWKFWWILKLFVCFGIMSTRLALSAQVCCPKFLLDWSHRNSHQIANLFSLFFKFNRCKIIWENNLSFVILSIHSNDKQRLWVPELF